MIKILHENIFFFSGGVQQFQDISNVSTLHDPEGYDKGYNA